MEVRMTDIKKASYEFKRDVASVLSPRHNHVVGESIIRFIEDRIRFKVCLLILELFK
jgi:hypothetical protein